VLEDENVVVVVGVVVVVLALGGLGSTVGGEQAPPLFVPVSIYLPSGMFSNVTSMLPESEEIRREYRPCSVIPRGLQNM